MPRTVGHAAGVVLVKAMVKCCADIAATAFAPESESSLPTVPTTLRFTSETLTLPGREKMGMLGSSMLFDVSQHARVGVGSYGAVHGECGGFITLGVEGVLGQPLVDAWSARSGLFVGAGGSRGLHPFWLRLCDARLQTLKSNICHGDGGARAIWLW